MSRWWRYASNFSEKEDSSLSSVKHGAYKSEVTKLRGYEDTKLRNFTTSHLHILSFI